MIKHYFLGTTNIHKIREIGSILSATGCTFEPTDPVDPEETEPDFEGNALLKARAYAKHSGGPTISEDSGIIIPALKGLPGPWSARFSDYLGVDIEEGTVSEYTPTGFDLPSDVARDKRDYLNNERVLALMKDVPQPLRAASFKVVLCCATPEGEILFKATGESYGWIAEQTRGTNGFGYDPIFVGGDTYGKTYGELDSMRKNLRSHRRKVLQDFQAWLSKQAMGAT